MSLTCGIDIGGTKIAGGVVDEEGTILEELRVVSPASSEEAIEEAVAGLVRELRSRHDVRAVGVGAAGYVDRSRSVVMFAPNIAWRDVEMRADLERRLDLPVVIENDANAAAWGEFRFGAGHDVEDLLLVTVGTGVGGGIVLDGALHRGAFGVGAEIGHMRVVPNGILCGWCARPGQPRPAARSWPARCSTWPAATPRPSPGPSSPRPPAPATRSPSSSSPTSVAGSARASPR
jgi:glucokinase